VTEPHSFSPEKALKLRKSAKRKKPKFVRPESWKYVRLKENWRNPQGLDNKVRMRIKGWPPKVSAGYRGPRIARELHPSGYTEILVYNAEQLKNVDPKTQAARIGHTVGKRKKFRILSEARRRKIRVLNLKEATLETKEGTKEKEEPPEDTKKAEQRLEGTGKQPKTERREKKEKSRKTETKEKEQ
jgi:large subunit ribosomal protein L32e